MLEQVVFNDSELLPVFCVRISETFDASKTIVFA